MAQHPVELGVEKSRVGDLADRDIDQGLQLGHIGLARASGGEVAAAQKRAQGQEVRRDHGLALGVGPERELAGRHQAAAGITADTRAMAITVSQSTGTVTVFQDGGIVLTLQRATMTRW